MAVTVGTDSYGDEAGLEAYAAERGVTVVGDSSELLIKGMDWLEVQPIHSYKYEEDQALEFPRALRLYGDESGVVPADIIKAQYAASLLIDSGEDLTPKIERAVKRIKVDVIEKEFMEGADSTTGYPYLTMLIRDYLSSYGGAFQVVRV